MAAPRSVYRHLIGFTALVCAFATGGVRAETMRLERVAADVYAIVGDLGNRSPENLGNNSTHGFVVTTAGVVLIDSGATRDGAQRLQGFIRQVTDQPVVRVINTGGQDHRWLGNHYFRELGAKIVASAAAVEDQRARVTDQLFGLANLVGESAVRATVPAYADTVFETRWTETLGGTRIEVIHAGAAHTPGDSYVMLPDAGVVFTGDIVYVERMLGVLEVSSSRNWIEVFESMAARQPRVIVPGHGSPTDLARARADTLDYLVFLRTAIGAFMEQGGDIVDIASVDQSRFADLRNFESLAGRNAQRVYAEMEWE